MAKRKIKGRTTVYMATDERDKDFFQPLKDYYDLVFLDDFHDEALIGINTNYYGMIDQLVATRSRVFMGCWFST
jgi:GDP-fucose protein O-fucosyltransferase